MFFLSHCSKAKKFASRIRLAPKGAKPYPKQARAPALEV